MRIVFLGTPEFAVPSLHRLAAEPGWQVTSVVCQPDRPAGRGGALKAPAVKLAAGALGIPVHQPERLRGAAEAAWLREQRPDALAVVAFGQILRPDIITLPPLGAINGHASMLPNYRGAAPIQWAIARGETETGVTTMRINAGLDTGDMLLQVACPIGPDATAPEISATLADLAAHLMAKTLAGLERGAITARPQPRDGLPAPLLTRADGTVDWRRPALEIYNRWRGFQPWPGLHTYFRGKTLAIVECRPLAGVSGEPGEWYERDGTLVACCGEGALALERVRLDGRQTTSGIEFARGARLLPGERLS